MRIAAAPFLTVGFVLSSLVADVSRSLDLAFSHLVELVYE